MRSSQIILIVFAVLLLLGGYFAWRQLDQQFNQLEGTIDQLEERAEQAEQRAAEASATERPLDSA